MPECPYLLTIKRFYGLGLGLTDIPYQSPTHLGNNSIKSIDTTYEPIWKRGIPDHTHTPFRGVCSRVFSCFLRRPRAVAIALLMTQIEGLNGMNTRPAFLVVVQKEDAHMLVFHGVLPPTMLDLLKQGEKIVSFISHTWMEYVCI